MVPKLVLAIPLGLACFVGFNHAYAARPEHLGPAARPPVSLPPVARAPVRMKAPEIDATAGIQAIALLSGVLLLVGERVRRRRG